MAEENSGRQPAGNDQQRPAQQSAPQNLGVLAQYIKDMSFESPGAPQSLRERGTAPTINITINVEPGQVTDNEVEVELKVDVKATTGDDNTILFAIELVYAGLFRLTNIPKEAVQPILRVECPRLLFPFARQIIAEASRNGGFPPLLIDPIDFLALFRQRLAQAQQAAAAAQSGEGQSTA
ncbi:protein-export chaperone SecB [Bauldia sp.]|uniref:protein-export chaperone SecB n=1 Tax=Bauldia sp. TaxID=2575872 RepID=UPI003BA9E1DC